MFLFLVCYFYNYFAIYMLFLLCSQCNNTTEQSCILWESRKSLKSSKAQVRFLRCCLGYAEVPPRGAPNSHCFSPCFPSVTLWGRAPPLSCSCGSLHPHEFTGNLRNFSFLTSPNHQSPYSSGVLSPGGLSKLQVIIICTLSNQFLLSLTSVLTCKQQKELRTVLFFFLVPL